MRLSRKTRTWESLRPRLASPPPRAAREPGSFHRSNKHHLPTPAAQTQRQMVPGGHHSPVMAESVRVLGVMEDRFAPVATIHDVINRAGTFNSQLPGNAGKLKAIRRLVNIKN